MTGHQRLDVPSGLFVVVWLAFSLMYITVQPVGAYSFCRHRRAGGGLAV
jgi:hypothetical protein